MPEASGGMSMRRNKERYRAVRKGRREEELTPRLFPYPGEERDESIPELSTGINP
jgi:hypothetical protein